MSGFGGRGTSAPEQDDTTASASPKADTPYRFRVADSDESLPHLIRTDFDVLLAEDRIDYRACRQPPDRWMAHINAHRSPKGYEQEGDAEPEPVFFVASIIWSLLLSMLWWLVRQGHKPDLISGLTIAAVIGTFLIGSLGLLSWIGTAKDFKKRGVPEDQAEWYAARGFIKYILLPPVSLYLSFKEVVAWRAWKKAGRRWSALPWTEELAIWRVVESFRKEMDIHTAFRERIKERGIALRKEARQVREHGSGLVQKASNEEQPDLAGHYRITGEAERKRANELDQEADRLKGLEQKADDRLVELTILTSAYKELQLSRSRLRAADALVPTTAALELQEKLRQTHLALCALEREEKPVKAPVDPLSQDEDARLSAEIERVAEQKGVR